MLKIVKREAYNVYTLVNQEAEVSLFFSRFKIFLNRLYILDQFYVHSKIEQKLKGSYSPPDTLPQHMHTHSPLTINVPYDTGTFVTQWTYTDTS